MSMRMRVSMLAWHTRHVSVTSIRLDSRTRDRLAAIANRDYRGASLGAALDRLIDEHEMRQVHAAYERLRRDPAAWAEYQEELRLTDNAAADGLGDARDEYPEYNR
jgi:hypothetical protein